MTLNRFGRKLLKITGICLGIIAMLLMAFHFWFIAHAKELLQDTVEKKSNGKLKLKVEKLSYNYFSRTMVIKQAVFINTDTLTAPSSYRFAVKEIRLQLKALLPLVLKQKLLIDSLQLQSPDIVVTTLRLTKDTVRRQPKDVSIPYEMGKVYNSIQDALKVLQVNHFQIDDGSFSLINKVQPGQLPLHISNIHFHIDNLQVDTARLTGQEKLLFSDNVVLRSHHQDIVFPDRRHRLSFSSFRINLQNKLVEFDSCTILAIRTDSSSSSFRVFFDTLKLTNIDFDTLYRAEVIKADSVYCLNPRFSLEVDAGKKKGPKRSIPKLENIVQQLTGNLQLGFVVVQNADFDIKTIKDGKPTSFAFSKNNFEMQGLSVDQDAVKPITVKSFTMAIRNYENFIKDSSYIVKFDSVRLRDDRIILSSFLFNKLDHGKILNSFSVPEFRLEGLSWDDLVLERKLKAKSAAMIRPHINYTADPVKKQEKQTIFQSLGAVNEFMDLEQLEIVDGTIDLNLRKDLRVQLEDANLSVRSQSLLSSTQLSGIKNSLNGLDFRHGKIQAGSTTVELNNIIYTGESGQFTAGSIWVNNPEKNMNTFLEEVAVDKLVVNETNGSIQAEGINWQKADIKFFPADTGKTDSWSGPAIDLKKIEGHNTVFSGMINNNTISTNLQYISLDELKRMPADHLILKGLAAAGHKLIINGSDMQLSVSEYSFTDDRFSSFRNMELSLHTSKLSGTISTPSLSFVTNVQRLLDQDLSAEVFSVLNPVARLRFFRENNPAKDHGRGFPTFRIGKLKLEGADIDIVNVSGHDSVSLQWNGGKNPQNNYISVSGLQTEGNSAAADSLDFYLTDLSFIDTKGKTFNTGDGNLAAKIRSITIKQKENEPVTWKASISMLDAENFRLDSIGRKKGRFTLNSAGLKEFQINSTSIQHMQQLAAANTSFQLTRFTGHYSDATSQFRWYNAGFDRSSNSFSLDSFSFRPVLEKDSFLISKQYQTDYIRAGTGAVRIGPVDLDGFIKDSNLYIKKLWVNDAYFYDHKDKSLPFNAGIIKPLPVNMIKKIPFNLAIDSTELHNARVEYTEVNEKNKLTGTIPVTRMSVHLFNLKNYNLTDKDSFSIRAVGYLMDAIWTRLLVKESYTDSLGGFLMTLRIKPGDLTMLNSALVPLASIKLISGKLLDTLDMRAIGREYLAMGEMKMIYENLKIQILKNGQETNRPFMTKLASFLANTFVIKTNNRSQTSNVFFIRRRDKSAINYLIKIALSGMTSSVGAKSNKKMMRQYRKELEKRGLPRLILSSW